MLLFDDRETSRSTANMFADASPKLRRCIGDASATSWDCFWHRETSRVLQKNSMHALKFFAMHSRGFVWKNDRRCIAECSAMHPRTLLNKFYFPKHRRCIAEVSAMLRGCIPEYSLNISGASGFCGRAQYTPVLIHASRKLVSFYIADVFSLVGP